MAQGTNLLTSHEARILAVNAGSEEQPVYFTGGEPTATSYALKATVNDGDAKYVAYYSNGRLIASSKPTYDMRMPAHYFHNLYEDNPTTGTNVYVHYYNIDTTSTNTYANLRVKSGSTFKTLLFGGDGNCDWEGNILAIGGILQSSANGNTVQIGSQNNGFCHIISSANIPFYFNRTTLVDGDLGNTSYPVKNIIMGKSNGAGIYYQGSKANYRMIRFIDNTSDNYGNGISIGGGGQTIIGGGESADTAAAQVGTGGSEIMYVCNDGNVDIISNLQNGWDSRKVMTLNIYGYLMLPNYINSPTSNNENPTVSQFIVTNGSDSYYRKASTTHVMAAIRGAASGTWGINITGSSASAAGIYSATANGDNIAALKSVWNNLPANQTLGVYIAHGSASFFYGWRLSGYAVESAYGGGIIDNYGNPDYVNISAGSFVAKHIWLEGDSVTSAVWNDYAEARESLCTEPGRTVQETGSDTLILITERLASCAGIISDTWGFSQGETDSAKTHIAVAGRVLAYPYRDRNEYKPGDVLCAAPDGTVDIMTREEVIQYPDRIVGTVSCVPDYKEWGGGEGADRPPVKVNGRIWVKVR